MLVFEYSNFLKFTEQFEPLRNIPPEGNKFCVICGCVHGNYFEFLMEMASDVARGKGAGLMGVTHKT